IVEFLLEASARSALAAMRQIRTAVEVLAAHPKIGRRVRGQLRELVISHGATGYLAPYRFDPSRDVVRILRVRHQREAGYRD
ncbi:MAG TPA: type II toxin-antitoxin system RelE/ParE family toxin, partial [Burkholderiales bacterium]